MVYLSNFETIELEQDNVKVEWDYIGEGFNGDYDPQDKEDTPLMRLYVYFNVEGEWVQVESCCTFFSAKSLFNEKYKSLINILQYVTIGLKHGKHIKQLVGDISYVSEDTYNTLTEIA